MVLIISVYSTRHMKRGRIMEQEVVYSSDYILITRRPDGYYIETFRQGISIEDFNQILSTHPEIKIINFVAIKNAIFKSPSRPEKFGIERERVLVDITSDGLRAYITLFVDEKEFLEQYKSKLLKEIVMALNSKGVVYGIKEELILANLCNSRQILAAEGAPPLNGTDASVRMYELKEARPEIKEGGNVDHYELNLINKVESGAWLGDRVDPTPGIPGKSVKGNIINAVSGSNIPLLYDRNSVKEVYDNGVSTLYATRSGAVTYRGDTITISNHLEIENGIDFRTGNVDFDGFLTVKGTIEDNFSIAALEDIEILGDYGVGSVKEIESRRGSIYIKGGIAGKSKAVIKSKRDIYTKFVSDATIICEGRVHIGFYCLNSNIIAKEVILDSIKGQIIGGNVQAEIRVVSSIIGSASEKKTHITVKGFDRLVFKDKLEWVVNESESVKKELNKAKNNLTNLIDRSGRISPEMWRNYEIASAYYAELKDKLKDLDREKINLVNYLRARGEGEVSILKRAFPGTIIDIRGNIKDIEKPLLKTTFYLQDGEILSI